MQDIRVSQPVSPLVGKGIGMGLVMKERRGSEVSKGNKKESKEKSRIKTEFSTKCLVGEKRSSQREESNKKQRVFEKEEMKDESK